MTTERILVGLGLIGLLAVGGAWWARTAEAPVDEWDDLPAPEGGDLLDRSAWLLDQARAQEPGAAPKGVTTDDGAAWLVWRDEDGFPCFQSADAPDAEPACLRPRTHEPSRMDERAKALKERLKEEGPAVMGKGAGEAKR